MGLLNVDPSTYTVPTNQALLFSVTDGNTTTYKYKLSSGTVTALASDSAVAIINALDVKVADLPCLVYETDLNKCLNTNFVSVGDMAIAMATKASVKYVKQIADQKVNKATFLATIAGMPTNEEMASALSVKANASDVETSLSGKADASSVYTQEQTLALLESFIAAKTVNNIEELNALEPGINRFVWVIDPSADTTLEVTDAPALYRWQPAQGSVAAHYEFLQTATSGAFSGTIQNILSILGDGFDSDNTVTAKVTEIETSLSGKASTSHTHAIGDVTDLQTSLDAKLTQGVADTLYLSISGANAKMGKVTDAEEDAIALFDSDGSVKDSGVGIGASYLQPAVDYITTSVTKYPKATGTIEYNNESYYPWMRMGYDVVYTKSESPSVGNKVYLNTGDADNPVMTESVAITAVEGEYSSKLVATEAAVASAISTSIDGKLNIDGTSIMTGALCVGEVGDEAQPDTFARIDISGDMDSITPRNSHISFILTNGTDTYHTDLVMDNTAVMTKALCDDQYPSKLDYEAHVANQTTTLHVTAEEKSAWNAKVSTSDMTSAINTAVSGLTGVWHYRGSVANLDALNDLGEDERKAGYIYQVGDKEYVFSELKNDWELLGFSIDISSQLEEKMDLVEDATENNVAIFDEGGAVVDSGVSIGSDAITVNVTRIGTSSRTYEKGNSTIEYDGDTYYPWTNFGVGTVYTLDESPSVGDQLYRNTGASAAPVMEESGTVVVVNGSASSTKLATEAAVHAAITEGGFASASHTHEKSDITDFDESDYATADHTHDYSTVYAAKSSEHTHSNKTTLDLLLYQNGVFTVNGEEVSGSGSEAVDPSNVKLSDLTKISGLSNIAGGMPLEVVSLHQKSARAFAFKNGSTVKYTNTATPTTSTYCYSDTGLSTDKVIVSALIYRYVADGVYYYTSTAPASIATTTAFYDNVLLTGTAVNPSAVVTGTSGSMTYNSVKYSYDSTWSNKAVVSGGVVYERSEDDDFNGYDLIQVVPVNSAFHAQDRWGGIYKRTINTTTGAVTYAELSPFTSTNLRKGLYAYVSNSGDTALIAYCYKNATTGKCLFTATAPASITTSIKFYATQNCTGTAVTPTSVVTGTSGSIVYDGATYVYTASLNGFTSSKVLTCTKDLSELITKLLTSSSYYLKLRYLDAPLMGSTNAETQVWTSNFDANAQNWKIGTLLSSVSYSTINNLGYDGNSQVLLFYQHGETGTYDSFFNMPSASNSNTGRPNEEESFFDIYIINNDNEYELLVDQETLEAGCQLHDGTVLTDIAACVIKGDDGNYQAVEDLDGNVLITAAQIENGLYYEEGSSYHQVAKWNQKEKFELSLFDDGEIYIHPSMNATFGLANQKYTFDTSKTAPIYSDSYATDLENEIRGVILYLDSDLIDYSNLNTILSSKPGSVNDPVMAAVVSSKRGYSAFVDGEYNASIGYNAFVNGNSNECYGDWSVSGGLNNLMIGSMSVVYGSANIVTGDLCYTYGGSNKVGGSSNYVFGTSNFTYGQGGVAIGLRNSLFGVDTVSVGFSNQVYGNRSMTIGTRNIVNDKVNDVCLVGTSLETYAEKSYAIGNNGKIAKFQGNHIGEDTSVLNYAPVYGKAVMMNDATIRTAYVNKCATPIEITRDNLWKFEGKSLLVCESSDGTFSSETITSDHIGSYVKPTYFMSTNVGGTAWSSTRAAVTTSSTLNRWIIDEFDVDKEGIANKNGFFVCMGNGAQNNAEALTVMSYTKYLWQANDAYFATTKGSRSSLDSTLLIPFHQWKFTGIMSMNFTESSDSSSVIAYAFKNGSTIYYCNTASPTTSTVFTTEPNGTGTQIKPSAVGTDANSLKTVTLSGTVYTYSVSDNTTYQNGSEYETVIRDGGRVKTCDPGKDLTEATAILDYNTATRWNIMAQSEGTILLEPHNWPESAEGYVVINAQGSTDVAISWDKFGYNSDDTDDTLNHFDSSLQWAIGSSEPSTYYGTQGFVVIKIMVFNNVPVAQVIVNTLVRPS